MPRKGKTRKEIILQPAYEIDIEKLDAHFDHKINLPETSSEDLNRIE